MAIANHFYNSTTRKYVALFGSIFNRMLITREDNEGVEVHRMIVPISYGPWQKFLSKVVQDPNLNRKQSISLPRMSFEIVGLNYDGSRKLLSAKQMSTGFSGDNGSFSNVPTPYNIEFSLYVMTKYTEDGSKIVEQILPFFKPDFTVTAKLIDNLDPIDIPIMLNGVSSEDLYEGDYETRRTLMWTLNFTMKAWFFGPTDRTKKIIKMVDVRYHNGIETNITPESQTLVRPGLTANGEPTSILADSVPYTEIDFDDDWGVIKIYQNYEED
jgi:hypothetical protein